MPINNKYKAEYCHGQFYHEFNRTTGEQLLFKKDENYTYFLNKIDKYLSPFIEVFAWCLLPNHFHLLIRIKEKTILESKFGTLGEFRTFETLQTDIHKELTKAFKNFFISYSKAYKKMFNQSTNLFAPKYKHIKLETDNDVCALIQYIHRNPLHHKTFLDWQNYKWSSFGRLKKRVSSKLKCSEVYSLFGGYNEFIRTHEENTQLYKNGLEYEF